MEMQQRKGKKPKKQSTCYLIFYRMNCDKNCRVALLLGLVSLLLSKDAGIELTASWN